MCVCINEHVGIHEDLHVTLYVFFCVMCAWVYVFYTSVDMDDYVRCLCIRVWICVIVYTVVNKYVRVCT